MNATEYQISDEEIAGRAYEIWQARGCPASDGSEDWRAAKAELLKARVRRGDSTQKRLESWWGRMRQKLAGENS